MNFPILAKYKEDGGMCSMRFTVLFVSECYGHVVDQGTSDWKLGHTSDNWTSVWDESVWDIVVDFKEIENLQRIVSELRSADKRALQYKEAADYISTPAEGVKSWLFENRPDVCVQYVESMNKQIIQLLSKMDSSLMGEWARSGILDRQKKVALIKEYRIQTGCGLYEAKKWVEENIKFTRG